MLAAPVHLPLRQLALCLDCDECFAIGCPTCPACGSATWEVVRQLIIVAFDRAHLYKHLKRGFTGNGTVRVLLNRRVTVRRARSGPYETERRQADRRLPSKVDALLRAIGWAIVPLDAPKHHHR